MKIDLREVPIQEVVKYSKHLMECQGFSDKGEDGVYGMEGRLNIRPIYQREFVYKDAQRDAVINTIINNFPLSVLYWVENKDGSYEVLDGQQRLISIGQFVSGGFSVEWPEIGQMYFDNLTDDQQDQILNYNLMVHFCSGDSSEKLKWFERINIAGEKLTEQEIKNAIFSGPWVSDAKRYFSKNLCPAYKIAGDYLKGSPIRQDYLETIIEWISDKNIHDYMATHQHNNNAEELWAYFNNVINWVKSIFINYRKEMKGVPFGLLYNKYKDLKLDPSTTERQVKRLMEDEDVQKKSGIYSYVFTGDERNLNLRAFTDNQKREAYEKQSGICPYCKRQFDIDAMHADHIVPWSKGGKTVPGNCQMLCRNCNLTKSDK